MNEEPDDLGWLAFCYVAGELTDDEAAGFEARLDHDQAAREAVAEVVALAAAVRAVGRPCHRAVPRRRLVTMAALAASCLALVAGPKLLPWQPGAPGAVETDPQKILALTWSGLWQTSETAAEAELPLGVTDDSLIAHGDSLVAWLDDPAAPADRVPGDDAADPPDWMLEAASLHETDHPAAPGS